MTELERESQRLHRYHDGELAGMERLLFERRLRRSPGLQAELRALAQVSELVARAEPDPAVGRGPDLWAGIASALPAIDAQVADEQTGAARRSERAQPASRGWPGLPGWAAGAAALAAAAAVALVVLVGRPGSSPPDASPPDASSGARLPVVASSAGVVRYLDSRGAPVIVIENAADDVTIVWMMDAV